MARQTGYMTVDEADDDSEISFDQQLIYPHRSNNASPTSSYRSASYHESDVEENYLYVQRQQSNNRVITPRDVQSRFRSNDDNRNSKSSKQSSAQCEIERHTQTQRSNERFGDASGIRRRDRVENVRHAAACSADTRGLSEFSIDTNHTRERDRIVDTRYASERHERSLNMQTRAEIDGGRIQNALDRSRIPLAADVITRTNDRNYNIATQSDTQQPRDLSIATDTQTYNQNREREIPRNEQVSYRNTRCYDERSVSLDVAQACERIHECETQRLQGLRLIENEQRRSRGRSVGVDDDFLGNRVPNRELPDRWQGNNWGLGNGMPSDARQLDVPVRHRADARVQFRDSDRELQRAAQKAYENLLCLDDAYPHNENFDCDLRANARQVGGFDREARPLRDNRVNTQDNYTADRNDARRRDTSSRTRPTNDVRRTSDDHCSPAKNRKHNMKPGKFDGNMPLETFLRQFEICAKNNAWNDDEKSDYLQCALVGNPA